MPCQIFDCGVRSRCAPLNPCGVPMTNPFVRASVNWFNDKYTTSYSAGSTWVCDAPCKYVAYMAPSCCLPKRTVREYVPEKKCCNDYDSCSSETYSSDTHKKSDCSSKSKPKHDSTSGSYCTKTVTDTKSHTETKSQTETKSHTETCSPKSH